jgi:chemotaxis protein histidine kinase CheA
MRNSYHDKELNRLLAEADELLSDVNLNLYETPAEEQARKQAEAAEAARKQAEEDRKRAAAEAAERARRQEEAAARQAAAEAEAQARRQAEEAARQAAAEAEAQARRQAEETARQAEAQARRQAEEAAKRAEAEAEAVRRQVAVEAAEAARRQAEEAVHRQAEPVEEVSEAAEEETAVAEPVSEQTEDDKKRKVNVLRDSVWGTVCYAALTMIYMEVILHFAVYRTMDTNVFQSAAFAAAAGCIIVLAVSWLPEKVNHIVCMILLILGCGWFDFQIISHSWNESYALLSMDIGYPLQVLKNIIPALQSTGADMVWMVLMFAPVILFGIFGRKLLPLHRAGWMNRVLMGLAGILLAVVGFLCIEAHGAGEGTPYETVRRFDANVDQEQAVEQMGITGTVLLEGMEAFR